MTAEGEGDRALLQWLQGLCDDRGLHLHLDIAVAGGSNARWVVEYAVDRRRRRNISKTGDVGALVFLDADRLDEDRAAGRDPQTVPGREHLKLVFLRPKLEGLLIRLHGGWERRFVAAQDAERQLKRLWPQYRKPMPAHALRERFGLDDLRRAAAHDRGLRDALTMLGLIP